MQEATTNIKIYLPEPVCTTCQGKCCKGMPGAYHPNDFPQPMTISLLRSLLKTGKVKVDWWETDSTPGYFLRPSTKTERPEDTFVGSWGGTCIHLTDSGCELKFEDRPLSCRALKPGSDNKLCRSEYTKYEAYKAWEKYQPLFLELENNS